MKAQKIINYNLNILYHEDGVSNRWSLKDKINVIFVLEQNFGAPKTHLRMVKSFVSEF